MSDEELPEVKPDQEAEPVEESPLEEAAPAEESPIEEAAPEQTSLTEVEETQQAASSPEETSQKFIINKVQIRPAKQLDIDIDTKSPNYLTSLPVIACGPKKYTPMPYTFRIPAATKLTKVTNVLAKSPPFHLLLDHTIAVVWQTFSDNEYTAPLGIGQLQWALTFLKTIVNRQGDHPKDIDHCISVIEDFLLEEYADLNQEITKMDQIDESTRYFDGFFGTPSLITKKVPFSLNYNEMMHRLPSKPDSDYEAKMKQSSMTPDEINDEIENIRRAEDEENLDSLSKDKAIAFLNIYKSGQVDRIRTELRKLMSIEDLMKSIGVDSIDGYLDEKAINVLFGQ